MKKVNTFLTNVGEHMTFGNVVKVTFLAVAAIAAYKKARSMYMQRQGKQMVQQSQSGPMIIGPSPDLHKMAMYRQQQMAQQQQMFQQQNNPMQGVPQAPVPQMPVPPQYQPQEQVPQMVNPVTQFRKGDERSASIEQQMNQDINLDDYFPSVPNMDEMPNGMGEDGFF